MATVEILRVIHRSVRARKGRRKGGNNFLVELRIDSWLIVRTNVKFDVFEYLRERGIEAVEEKGQ